jgi:hypothetical protein
LEYGAIGCAYRRNVSSFAARMVRFSEVDTSRSGAYMAGRSTLRARSVHARGQAQEGSESGFI